MGWDGGELVPVKAQANRVVQINTTISPLTKCDVKTLVQHWPLVRAGLVAVKKKYGDDAGNWTPEHIRSQLELRFADKGTCELHLIMDNGPKGFLVTIVGNCPYLNVPQSLIIWVAYTFEPLRPVIARAVLKQAETYARTLGLKYVDGYSSNPKWGSWLRRYGENYLPVQILTRKKLYKEG